MPPAVKRNPCIRAVKAANKAGKITDAQASGLIDDMLNRARQSRAKYLGDIKTALKEISGEMIRTDDSKRAIAKRNTLLNYKAAQSMIDYANNGKFKTFGEALKKYMNLTDMAGKDLGGRFIRKMLNSWEADGVAEEAFTNFPEKDFYAEMWNLSAGQGRATTNDAAFKIAKGFWSVKDESITLKNMFGAFINRAEGHVTIQSHDSAKIRAGGERGFFGWGDKAKAKSYKVWRDSLNGLNIDWARTSDGGDKEEFLKAFHDRVYMGMFTENLDTVSSMVAFKSHGALANKMSSKRVFWFADAESAYKYNQMWGARNVLEEILGELTQSGRQIAILQRMGPNPEGALKTATAKLLNTVEKTAPDNWKKQERSLTANSLGWYWKELSGAQSHSEHPTFSRIIDNIKSIAVMGHSGNMLLPSLGGDQALMMSGSMYQGVKLMDFFRMRYKTFMPLTPERKKHLEQTSFVAHAYVGNIMRRWIYDIRPSLFIDKTMKWQMKLTGMTDWTNINERAASEIGSMVLGSHADTPWSGLDPKYQELLDRYSITPQEWDTVRLKAYRVADYGNAPVLSHDVAENLTDQEVANILTANGEKITTANIARAKARLVSGIGAYLTDFMHASTGRPTLAFRAWKGLGIPRGNVAREAMELFSIFKSFPAMAWIRATESFKQHYVPKNGMSYTKWLASNKHGMIWMSSYVAMTYLAGVVAQSLGDIVMGRNPLPLFDENGNPIMKTIVRHLARGGGAGIVGDLLFSEYDRNTRDIFSVLAGPAFGQLPNLTRMYTMATRGIAGDTETAEKLPYYAFRNVERNLPFINLFWIKPLYDQMIGWQLKEALSPGMLRRMERSVARENNQDFWLSPTSATDYEFMDVSGKIAHLMESLGDIDVSLQAK